MEYKAIYWTLVYSQKAIIKHTSMWQLKEGAVKAADSGVMVSVKVLGILKIKIKKK